MVLDVRFADTAFHRLTLYFLDWYDLLGAETITVLDKVSGETLDEEFLPVFSNGTYLTWDIRGHVQLRISRDAGSPGLVSGIFFDASPFLPTITITKPTANAYFTSPTNITLTADAATDPANVGNVDFYDGTNFLGSVTSSPPYRLEWANPPLGRHSLIARETGTAGTADSSPVTIFIFDTNSVSFISMNLLPDGTAQLDAYGPVGGLMRLEATDSLNANTPWTSLSTNSSSDNLFHFVVTDPTNYPQRFYRVIALP